MIICHEQAWIFLRLGFTALHACDILSKLKVYWTIPASRWTPMTCSGSSSAICWIGGYYHIRQYPAWLICTPQ